MGIIGASFATVNPSYIMPEVLMMYSQSSGAFELLADGDPMVRLGEGDLYVYVKTMDVRTKVAAGQTAYNALPSATLIMNYVSTPTYLLRTRAEYDHHDTAMAERWGVSLPEGQRLAMRQGIFQQMRNGLLYGFNPANGEGLLNTQGATTVSLPADSDGNTTFSTYDNGQLAIFLLTQIAQIKTRTYQFGIPARIVICGPQRILGGMQTQNIVQLTQFQRAGAGSETTAGVVTAVSEMNNDDVEWVFDDTLIGKGAGGTDAIIMAIPEIKRQTRQKFDTNIFSSLRPGITGTILQLLDMAAPREIPTPLPGGAIDVLAEQRMTPGWALRPEAVVIISMQFS